VDFDGLSWASPPFRRFLNPLARHPRLNAGLPGFASPSTFPSQGFSPPQGFASNVFFVALFHATTTHRVLFLRSFSRAGSRSRLRAITLLALQDNEVFDQVRSARRRSPHPAPHGAFTFPPTTRGQRNDPSKLNHFHVSSTTCVQVQPHRSPVPGGVV